jgi:CRISPR-associated protein Cmr1
MSEQTKTRASDTVTQTPGHSVPRAPAYASLPAAKTRATRGGPEVREIGVRLEVVTPILGGAIETRAVDEIDVIRAATVRGHLRFWWRALYAAQHPSASALYARESEIWGRAATDEGGRSAVEICIHGERTAGIDSSDIQLYDSKDGKATPGAYALWPAREEKKKNTPTAPRRAPGTQFRLTLNAVASCEKEVRNALRAWILFGGYGGRTRRGLGSLKVLDDVTAWLPSKVTRDALKDLFGFDILDSPTHAPGDTPWLGGAALQVGDADRDAMKAWTTALDWLKEFRQGTSGQQGDRAREPGKGKPQPQRPSISNWPEADKVRHLEGKTRGHAPRHNASPVWPRAGFGLPIIGRFQKDARNGGEYDEPDAFELRWRSPKKDHPGEFEEHDRLASPLIVKALPLADGLFVPCALWLNRAYPSNAEVGLARPKPGGRPNEKEVDPRTVAPFDLLVAPGDTAQFSALANKQGLRAAFLDWLHANYQTTVVAP